MKERINRKDDKRVYQPRIRAIRIKDLHEMKEFTRRPMTVLLDEALSIYLANFITSPEYVAWCEQIENGVDQRPNYNADDYDDLSNYLDHA
jgi:hypothetical protein